MATRKIDIHDFDLDNMLQLVRDDVEVLLVKDDIPFARITPIPIEQEVKPRVAGLHAGTTWVSDDFDDPLPDEFWLGKE